MSIQHLLRELFDRGIKLAIKGDQLQIQAPKGALDAELRDRLATNKTSILAMLRDGPIDARSEVHAVVVPAPDKRHEPFPLTDIQRAYWLGRTGAFTIPSGIHYYREYDCVDLDIDRLRCAFQKVVARHDMLRAHTLPDMLQVIEADVAVDIEVRDLRNLEPTERQAKLESMRETMAHRIYDTSQLPLHHVVAVRLDEQSTRLVVSIDLINVDGGSLAILFNDWMRFYAAPDLSLPPLEFSYRDYFFALDANRNTPSYQRSLDYWRNRIKDLAPAPVLPIAKDPAALELIRFDHLEAHLDLATWEKLQSRARTAGMTTAIVFITAYAEAISRFSANARFTLNVTLFNRLPVHPEVDEIIGDFSSMLLLSVDSGQTLSFTQKAQQIQTQLWEAMEHRQVSGIEVQREVARVWDDHRGALFPVVFTSLQNQRTGGLDALAQIGKLNYQITQTPQLLIDHQLCERVGDAVILWDVVKGVYPDGLVENMFEVYTTLLRRLAHDDDVWNTNQLDLLPSKQRTRLEAVNAPPIGSLPEELIHTSFERRVDETPEKLAVITSRRALTYAEVERRANAIAHHLRARGIGPDKPVPILMEKGWEQVVAIFAVLKAGGAYVPLDVGGSEERLRGIIEDSGARVVLTQSKYTSEPWGRGVELLAVDDDAFAVGAQGRLAPVQQPDHLAFVLYTSGSTGQPKGAMIELRGLIHRLWETAERFGLEKSDIALGLTGLHHDLSVFDVCGVLGIIGGTLVLPDADKTRDPGHWISLIEAHRVTLWNTVPAFMQMLVEYVDERPEIAEKLRSLRWAIWGGDFIPLDLPKRVRALVPHIALNSSGGPTETTLWNICYPIEAVDPAWKSIPYGRPMRHATYHIFDEQLRERPDWVPGEMYIGGLGLARGYWHDEPKTRERFIIHPVTGERLYKSGDLGRWLPDGNIEILGRADFQVKIRGYRIELGEVEAAVQAHPSVKQAVVLAIGTNAKDKRLCAYVVRETQAQLGASDAPKLLLDEADKVAFKLARHGLRQDLAAAPTVAFGKITPDETLLERYARRRSIRTFLDKPVQLGDLGRFLSVLAPITPPGTILPKYLYPSGGSLYPVQTYVYVKPGCVAGLEPGFHYYDPVENALRLVSDKPLEASAHVSWNLEIFEQAAFVLLFVGKRAAVEPLYGPMARDFCVLEAGYMGQLLMEQAPALGLGVCPLGYVDFAQLRLVLGVDDSSFFAHGMFGGCAEPTQFAAATLATESVPAPKAKTTVFSDELRPFLQKKLPEYMIPTAFVELDALPLTANGKVDRKALLALEPTVSAPPTNEPTAPANELETNILAVISEVVGAPNIRVEQNFFDAGATSLHIVIIAKRLREKLDLDVPVTLLFQASNVRALALAVASSNPHAVNVDKALERGEARRKARLRR